MLCLLEHIQAVKSRVSSPPVTEYKFDLGLTASFPHANKAFTQGLTKKNICQDDIGTLLDKCARSYSNKKRANCYTRELNRCLELYESSGLYGTSSVRKIVDFDQGKVNASISFSNIKFFAEGLDFIQLKDTRGDTSSDEETQLLLASWREQRIFVLNSRTLAVEEEWLVENPSEHWGLATDGKTKLWMTSGGDKLYFFDLAKNPPKTDPSLSEHILYRPYMQETWGDIKETAGEMKETAGDMSEKTIAIKRLGSPDRVYKLKCRGRSLHQMNELEYDERANTIWGNLWMSSKVVEIDLADGNCVGILDLQQDTRLETPGRTDINAVWNGIVLLGNKWLLFTGKKFNNIYLAKLK